MKANELMIFDLIRRKKDGKSMTVVELRYAETIAAITPDDVYYGDMEDYHESEIEPIPLTPEILEKNGFFIGNYGEYWIREKKGESVSMDKYNYAILEKGSSAIYLTCKYVHELQHALRLCGIEKDIEL